MAVEKLSRTLERFLANGGFPAISIRVSLARSWKRIAGPMLAEKTSPSRYRHGILTVHVPNASWAQELQLSKPVLLDRIRSCLGNDTVRDIRFLVGTVSPMVEEPRPDPEPAEADPLPLLHSPEEIGRIPDPELRDLFRSILEKSSRRKR